MEKGVSLDQTVIYERSNPDLHCLVTHICPSKKVA